MRNEAPVFRITQILRIVSFVIMCVFTTTTIAWSAPPMYTIQVPEEHGSVTQRYKGEGERVIIHVQDAHANLSAQVNMAHSICALLTQLGVTENPFIGIEGAIGEYDLQELRDFPVQRVKEMVGIDYVKDGKLLGAELASVVSEHDFTLFGLECEDLFKKNFNAFLDVQSAYPDVEREIEIMEGYLTDLKGAVYGEHLAAFDGEASAYETNSVEMAQYLGSVFQHMHDLSIDDFSYTTLLQCKEAFSFRAAIDEEALDTELVTLSEAVANRDDTVSAQWIAYQSEMITKEQFIAFVCARAMKLDMSMKPYPQVAQFCTYLKKYNLIDIAALFQEVLQVNIAIRNILAQSKDEHLLIDLWIKHVQLKQLLALKAVKESVQAFRSDRMRHSMGYIVKGVQALSERNDVEIGSVELSVDIDEVLGKVDAFYSAAEDRDQALLHNLIQQMDVRDQPVGVLVAGGFHTEGIVEELQKRNISYLTVAPKIDSLFEDVAYMDRLMGNIAPINPMLASHFQMSRFNMSVKALSGDFFNEIQRNILTEAKGAMADIHLTEEEQNALTQHPEYKQLQKAIARINEIINTGELEAFMVDRGFKTEHDAVENVADVRLFIGEQVENCELVEEYLDFVVAGIEQRFSGDEEVLQSSDLDGRGEDFADTYGEVEDTDSEETEYRTSTAKEMGEETGVSRTFRGRVVHALNAIDSYFKSPRDNTFQSMLHLEFLYPTLLVVVAGFVLGLVSPLGHAVPIAIASPLGTIFLAGGVLTFLTTLLSQFPLSVNKPTMVLYEDDSFGDIMRFVLTREWVAQAILWLTPFFVVATNIGLIASSASVAAIVMSPTGIIGVVIASLAFVHLYCSTLLDAWASAIQQKNREQRLSAQVSVRTSTAKVMGVETKSSVAIFKENKPNTVLDMILSVFTFFEGWKIFLGGAVLGLVLMFVGCIVFFSHASLIAGIYLWYLVALLGYRVIIQPIGTRLAYRYHAGVEINALLARYNIIEQLTEWGLYDDDNAAAWKKFFKRMHNVWEREYVSGDLDVSSSYSARRNQGATMYSEFSGLLKKASTWTKAKRRKVFDPKKYRDFSVGLFSLYYSERVVTADKKAGITMTGAKKETLGKSQAEVYLSELSEAVRSSGVDEDGEFVESLETIKNYFLNGLSEDIDFRISKEFNDDVVTPEEYLRGMRNIARNYGSRNASVVRELITDLLAALKSDAYSEVLGITYDNTKTADAPIASQRRFVQVVRDNIIGFSALALACLGSVVASILYLPTMFAVVPAAIGIGVAVYVSAVSLGWLGGVLAATASKESFVKRMMGAIDAHRFLADLFIAVFAVAGISVLLYAPIAAIIPPAVGVAYLSLSALGVICAVASHVGAEKADGSVSVFRENRTGSSINYFLTFFVMFEKWQFFILGSVLAGVTAIVTSILSNKGILSAGFDQSFGQFMYYFFPGLLIHRILLQPLGARLYYRYIGGKEMNDLLAAFEIVDRLKWFGLYTEETAEDWNSLFRRLYFSYEREYDGGPEDEASSWSGPRNQGEKQLRALYTLLKTAAKWPQEVREKVLSPDDMYPQSIPFKGSRDKAERLIERMKSQGRLLESVRTSTAKTPAEKSAQGEGYDVIFYRSNSHEVDQGSDIHAAVMKAYERAMEEVSRPENQEIIKRTMGAKEYDYLQWALKNYEVAVHQMNDGVSEGNQFRFVDGRVAVMGCVEYIKNGKTMLDLYMSPEKMQSLFASGSDAALQEAVALIMHEILDHGQTRTAHREAWRCVKEIGIQQSQAGDATLINGMMKSLLAMMPLLSARNIDGMINEFGREITAFQKKQMTKWGPDLAIEARVYGALLAYKTLDETGGVDKVEYREAIEAIMGTADLSVGERLKDASGVFNDLANRKNIEKSKVGVLVNIPRETAEFENLASKAHELGVRIISTQDATAENDVRKLTNAYLMNVVDVLSLPTWVNDIPFVAYAEMSKAELELSLVADQFMLGILIGSQGEVSFRNYFPALEEHQDLINKIAAQKTAQIALQSA